MLVAEWWGLQVSGAAAAMWKRVEGLQSEALKRDSRSLEEHMSWLQSGITTANH